MFACHLYSNMTMKNWLLATSLGLGLMGNAQAQTTPTRPVIGKQTEEYCQVKARPKLNGRYVISIDYGQQRKLISENLFRDASGKAVEFNSAMDALNWLNAQGWEFVNAFVLVEDNDSVAYYVLRRRIPA
jgi:hypothetical protein